MPDHFDRRVKAARLRVQECRGRYPEIAKACRTSVRWVNHFAQGRTADPGAVKFLRLERWLERQGIESDRVIVVVRKQ